MYDYLIKNGIVVDGTGQPVRGVPEPARAAHTVACDQFRPAGPDPTGRVEHLVVRSRSGISPVAVEHRAYGVARGVDAR